MSTGREGGGGGGSQTAENDIFKRYIFLAFQSDCFNTRSVSLAYFAQFLFFLNIIDLPVCHQFSRLFQSLLGLQRRHSR